METGLLSDGHLLGPYGGSCLARQVACCTLHSINLRGSCETQQSLLRLAQLLLPDLTTYDSCCTHAYFRLGTIWVVLPPSDPSAMCTALHTTEHSAFDCRVAQTS